MGPLAREDGRLLRRAGSRRRGPDGDGRDRAQRRRAGCAVCRDDGLLLRRTPSPHRHRDGARGGRRKDCDAAAARGEVRLPSVCRRAVREEGADRLVHAARAEQRAGRCHYRRLCCGRSAGAGGWLRRRGGDGVGGLPDQPVFGLADQPEERRVGRLLREPDAAPGGDCACGAGRRVGRLHPDLSPLDAGLGAGRLELGRGC
mmetsp:Transcript_45058/g.146378  ORF Transcript_45058/g.146378 Transcript_45058/m.146378 type:complete len:202 (+) Transcript_45058:234-839(+)